MFLMWFKRKKAWKMLTLCPYVSYVVLKSLKW